MRLVVGHPRRQSDADAYLDPLAGDAHRRDSQALVFASLAEELAEQLVRVDQPIAHELAAKGRGLAEQFREASLAPPEDDGSSSLVGDLIAFNRSALQLLSGR